MDTLRVHDAEVHSFNSRFSITRLDGTTTSNTNLLCLDLLIRPLVNPFPPGFFIFYTVKYTSEQSSESLVGFK